MFFVISYTGGDTYVNNGANNIGVIYPPPFIETVQWHLTPTIGQY